MQKQGNVEIAPSHLIIVPGHAIYIGTDRSQVYFTGPRNWVGTYTGYRYEDEVPLYVDHIRRGVVEASFDPASVLVFSGGHTRALDLVPAGTSPVSEAQGYWNLAEQCNWFNCMPVKARTKTEEFARDSYENLLFSWCLFRQEFRVNPEKVTVCGLMFKKARYEHHAAVIRRDLDVGSFRFNYLSVNDPPEYVLDAGSRLGEMETMAAFQADHHGEGDFLDGTRKGRDKVLRPFAYQLPQKKKAKQVVAELCLD
ncbi:MAG: hypothetical protein RBT11_19415 [Desulfobacterales bacterium]|jgi:hypothetical protein|nr:hypothetical protein [Desulfobacterales bacterium]